MGSVNLTCNKCGKTQPIYCCIDVWSNIEGKDYCLNCSKELKIGWYREVEIGDELKKKLIHACIDPLNVVSFTTKNDKKKKKIITKIILKDGSTRELSGDFVWYASRKYKKW